MRTGAASIALGVALMAAPSFAQSIQDDDTQSASQEKDIVVTGSLFRRAVETETASPVTVLSSESLAKSGISDITEAVRSIAADGAGSISTNWGSFAGGASTVSLRNVGAGSTLTLIDGLRSVNYPLMDDGHISFVDLNSIPFSAVQEVQVLKDGASSLYGADAIGGVVNMILKKRFNGFAGSVEGGATERGDGARYRANATVGFGDYASQGWNFYINGEYQADGRISNQDAGWPYNTKDLTSIGGKDGNPADNNLATATVNAVVRRATQTNLNDPFRGGVLSGGYQLLGSTADCSNGTFTVAGATGGTGCKHNNLYEYGQIQPKQERYSTTARFSARLSDNIELHAVGSYARSMVDYKGTPTSVNAVQPYRGNELDNSSNLVLPVWICPSGVNCADPATAGRTLNPNNPFATAYAADPANGAARLFYLFGDIPSGSHRVNEVLRGNIGLEGTFGEGWSWKADVVAAKDTLNVDLFGVVDIAGLRKAINTGAYNFVNPSLNTQAARDMVAPTYTHHAWSSMVSFDASIAKAVTDLPGGPLQVAVGGQVRREVQNNPGPNPNVDKFSSTAASFGAHTVSAGFFEISAPILDSLELTGSGRYDNYSEGFSAFSPKIGFTFKPIEQLMLRGTWSRGFRAPSFAERDPTSGFSGGYSITLPADYIASHGGVSAAYVLASASARGGFAGNPDLKPEKSRSFTLGAVIEPVRWLNFTVDYYNIKKTDVIVMAGEIGDAFAAYYKGQPLPDGYKLLAVADPDPDYPNALPRALLISGPYANGANELSTGLDVSASARVKIANDVRWTSTLNSTYAFEYSTTLANGAFYSYAGTRGPAVLSSGSGTPKWRANWQNSVQIQDLTLSVTAYFVDKIKNVAADAGAGTDLSCKQNLYGLGTGANGHPTDGTDFCYIDRFTYADLNAAYKVNDKFTFFVNVGNFTGAKAPIAPSMGSNYLTSFHAAGVNGRTFRAGARFGF
ncbi:TonB-dependent receptor domain-containing protein [Sphingomonas sp.]|uniref:TonB-dependent receptor domain-containing protein n=1 Tax=Sphingomonas sp. TaxID=28214 RepID=UPI002C1DFDFB|nr:TonB-dependent receptor [Sphingomonas sp.]HWK35460.1 TonB-dependent receptor [Sphingomonas sp.]